MKPKQAILWRISRPNLADSFLLGTIHINTAFAFTNFEKYQELILSCDAYAGESNLDELSSLQIPGQFDEEYLDEYRAHLSENQFKHLERFINSNIPEFESSWFFLHPMLLLSQIEVSFMGHDEQEFLDMALWNFAKSSNKELLAIESTSMQHQIFEDLDLEGSFRSIKRAISNLPSLRKKYQKLAQYYQEENIQALYLKTKKELGKLKHAMIYDRNFFMADRIAHLIQEKPTFIGIGVGHLPGEKGVLRLLKKKGFILEPCPR